MPNPSSNQKKQHTDPSSAKSSNPDQAKHPPTSPTYVARKRKREKQSGEVQKVENCDIPFKRRLRISLFPSHLGRHGMMSKLMSCSEVCLEVLG